MNSIFSHTAKFIILCAIGTILVAGCTSLLRFNQKVNGSGNVVKETRVLQDFTEVVLSEEGDLFIEIGDQNELVIEAEDNLQEYLIPETGDNVLDIKKLPENITLNATKPIRYYLTVKELKSLTGKNSGDNTGEDFPTMHFHEWAEEGIHVELLLKGGGCENVSTQYKLPDARLKAGRDLDGVRRVALRRLQLGHRLDDPLLRAGRGATQPGP